MQKASGCNSERFNLAKVTLSRSITPRWIACRKAFVQVFIDFRPFTLWRIAHGAGSRIPYIHVASVWLILCKGGIPTWFVLLQGPECHDACATEKQSLQYQ
ncbi:hypothetical protein [Erythrobacter sp.]|uniref:hypothetical protein n=1 Tax=Erythrobacter sp. TaxID=1042 RepID=UPI00311F5AEA